MKNKLWTILMLSGLIAGVPLFGSTCLADFVVPAIPPGDQIQQADANSVSGPSTPVNIQVQSGEKPSAAAPARENALQSRIQQILNEIVQDNPAIVLVTDVVPPPAPTAPGHAKNIISSPVKPGLQIQAIIGTANKGALTGKESFPVEIRVKKTAGKDLGNKKFTYRQDNEKKFIKDVTAYLDHHMHLSSAPVTVAGKDKQKPAPVLRSWIESSDGSDIRIGSKIALYYTSDTKGYVSVYHFGSSGNVQRVYPNAQEPYNFIESGKIYRFPATGWVTMEGPAGKETFKLILTTLPSNTPREQAGGLSYKMKPLHVIPTHFPVLFSDGDMMRFFALPVHLYTETHIKYSLQPAKKE